MLEMMVEQNIETILRTQLNKSPVNNILLSRFYQMCVPKYYYCNDNVISKLYCVYRGNVTVPLIKHYSIHNNKTKWQVEMLSGNCPELSTGRSSNYCPTNTLVKWCHVILQNSELTHWHQECCHWTNTYERKNQTNKYTDLLRLT